MNITITKTTHPGTLPPSDQLGFGTVFTDHMFLMDYSADKGWPHAPRRPPPPRERGGNTFLRNIDALIRKK